MWGAEELLVGLGGQSSRHDDGTYRDVARQVRSSTLLAAKAFGRWALDSSYLDIKDHEGLRTETLDAVAVGFDAKVAIHPDQIDIIRRAYEPSEPQVEWARHLHAATEPFQSGGAYVNFLTDEGAAKSAYEPETYSRLQRLKGKFDPDNVFALNHNILPA